MQTLYSNIDFAVNAFDAGDDKTRFRLCYNQTRFRFVLSPGGEL
jgi:hypothetical protein